MSDSSKKVTKREYLNTLTALVNFCKDENVGLPEGISYEGLTEFVSHEVVLLDNKAAAAAKRAENKKAEGDALREQVFTVLADSSEPMSAKEIAEVINDEEVTPNKVTARLTQLTKVQRAEKVDAPEGKKGTFYRAII